MSSSTRRLAVPTVCFLTLLLVFYTKIGIGITQPPQVELGAENPEDLELLTERATSEERFYGNESCPPNPHTKSFKSMFMKWKELAERLSIPFFLSAGSLIAAWRDGELIPYDYDIDVVVSYDNFHKLSKLRDERPMVIGSDEIPRLVVHHDWRVTDPYKRRLHNCQNRQVERVYEDGCAFRFPLAKMYAGKLHMDIFTFSLNKTTVHQDQPLVEFQLGENLHGTLQFGEVFPLKRCKFLGVDTRCPCNPRATFKMLYKGDMRPLKVCKQGKWVNRKK